MSFRIVLRETVPWLDAKGKSRFDVENMRQLDDAAAARIERDPELKVFSLGVVSVGVSPGGPVKPVFLTETLGSFTLGQAVDVQAAIDNSRQLLHLWSAAIESLPPVECCFAVVRETRWIDGSWRRAPELVSLGRAPELSSLTPLPDGGMHGELSEVALGELVRRWWPSPLGRLSVIAGPAVMRWRGAVSPDDGARTVQEADVPHIRWMFESAPSFHNLGLTLVIRAADSNDWVSKLLSRRISDNAEI